MAFSIDMFISGRPEKRKLADSNPASRSKECRKVCHSSEPTKILSSTDNIPSTDKITSTDIFPSVTDEVASELVTLSNCYPSNTATAITEKECSVSKKHVSEAVKNTSPTLEVVTDKKLAISENGSAANRRALEADDQLPHTGPDDPNRPARGYEYCDHTADIQIHAWGSTLKEAFEECVVGMFGYMTDISTVEARDTFSLEAEGEDVESLLFHFLDEWLYAFCVEPFFIPNEVNIVEFDEVNFKIKVEGYGEPFDLAKHPQGTEVKAITYSAMQIVSHGKGKDVYVIVDI